MMYLQIGIQLAVLIAKIARHDCPHHWQQLIPTLMVAIHHDDILLQQRALVTMYHVIKTLASKRLAHDQKLFEEVTFNNMRFCRTSTNFWGNLLLQLIFLC